MKQSDAQRIGLAGECLFQTMLPKGWIPQKLHPDYGEDFRILEVQDNDVQPGGFMVQVKTEEKIKLKGKYLRLQLEQKDLKFWTDPTYQHSLCLVVVDLFSKKGYWLFIQQYLEETLKGWKNKTKPTIYIPLANDLGNTEDFIAAVKEARRYITKATSLTAYQQIEEHFAYLRSLDSRFDYKYFQDGGTGTYTIHAKQPVQIHFQFKSKRKLDRENKRKRLFMMGEVVTFKPGELEINGSRLFERLAREGGSVQMRIDFRLHITVTLYQGDTRLTELSHLPTSMTGGRGNWSLATDAGRFPISFVLRGDETGKDGRFTVNFKLSDWNGVKTSQAKLFAATAKFIHFMGQATHLGLTYHVDGEELKEGKIDATRLKLSNFDELHNLYKLYYIVNYYQIDPTIYLDGRANWPDIEALYSLTIGEQCTQVVDDCFSLTANVLKADAEKFREHFLAESREIHFSAPFLFDIMGIAVEYAKTRLSIDKVEVSDRAKLDSLRNMLDGDVMEIPMRSVKGAKQTYSRHVDPEPVQN